MKLRFKKGDWTHPMDALIMVGTRSHYVHVEVKDGRTSYSAYEDITPAFQLSASEPEDNDKWTSIEIPLSDEDIARRYLLDICGAPLTYQMERRSVLPSKLIRLLYGGVDSDCENPNSWGTCFCSQAILLWLRRCAKHGILLANQNMEQLWGIHSRACHPRRLYNIAADLFESPKPK